SPVGKGLSSQDIHGLVVLRAGGKRCMVATTNNDLNLSDDGGDTWTPQRIERQLPWNYCRGLVHLTDSPTNLLLGNRDAPPVCIARSGLSLDCGDPWRYVLPNDANSTFWNFAVPPADPRLVFASSVSGQLYRSTDRGATWERLSREFGEIRALAWTP